MQHFLLRIPNGLFIIFALFDCRTKNMMGWYWGIPSTGARPYGHAPKL